MRPYLAVLKDSFREALVSRVLWILLILATLVLAGIAPAGLTEQPRSRLQGRDLKKPQALITKLRTEGVSTPNTPAQRVWDHLSEDLRTILKAYPRPTAAGGGGFTAVNDLREELNKVLEDPAFYDESAFSGIELNAEAKALAMAHQPDSPADDVARLNRLLLEAAFPEEIAPAKETHLRFSYLGFSLFSPFPAQKHQIVKGMVAAIVNIIVGFFGVLAGILVTASIVPQMFEAGAIDLLLSKPISRVLLFFTKFFGGCAFIFITGLYFIGGLWLIVGLRYGLWSTKLLMCIPVFMFLFAIYYSVSVLSGVLWKNAIICVVMTIVFWGICKGVGVVKVLIEQIGLNPTRVVNIIPAQDRLLAQDEAGQTLIWDAAKSNWQETFAATQRQDRNPFEPAPRTVGPVYDAQGKRLLTIEAGRFGIIGPKLLVGLEKDDFKQIEGPTVPDGPLTMWVDGGNVFVAGAEGIFRLEGDPTERQQKVNVLGFELPLDDKGGRFVSIGPNLQLGPRATAAVDPQTFDVAIYDQPRVAIYSRQESGRYKLRKQAEHDVGKSGLVALGGSQLLLAGASGKLQLLDSAELKPIEEFRPFQNNAPRFAAASGSGRYFAVLFHSGKLWLYDREAQRDVGKSITGQGDISALTITTDRLLVADRLRRVTQYQLGSLERTERWQGRLDTLEMIYRYAVKPIHTVFPKPSELDSLISYLLSEEETVALDENLASARVKLDIWGPVWSNLAFLAVMLGLGGLIVHYKDF